MAYLLSAISSPSGAILDVAKIWGCIAERAARGTPNLVDWASKRLLGCPDAFDFGPFNLSFCAAL